MLATIGALILLVVLRGHALASASWFEPDEAVLMAWGKRATLNLLPYAKYTTSDQTYLWPIFLGLLGDIGVPLTLTTAHVLSGLLYVLISVTAWLIFYRFHGWKWATVIATPVAVVLFVGVPFNYYDSFPDFLSLETELLPLAIICLAVLIVLYPLRPIGRGRLAVGSGLLGASIWASPQVTLLAFSTLMSFLFIKFIERHARLAPRELNARSVIRDCAAAAAAFIAPTAVSLALFAVTGEIGAFWHETVAFTLSYSSTGNTPAVVGIQGLLARINDVSSFVVGLPFAFIWGVGGLLSWHKVEGVSEWQWRARIVAWATPLASAILTLTLLNHLFGHYGNLLYAGSLVSGAVGCRLAWSQPSVPETRDRQYPMMRVLLVGLCIAVAAYVAMPTWQSLVFLRGYVASAIVHHRIEPVDYFYYGISSVQASCPANSRVLVWGQSSELYSYYHWMPASRYVSTDWQIFDLGDGHYVKDRLESELRASPPRCIVNAIGPDFFGQIPSDLTLSRVIPGTRNWLNQCYAERTAHVGSDQGSPENFQAVTVYVRTGTCRTS